MMMAAALNTPTIVVLALVGAAVIAAIVVLALRRARGKTCCDGNCAGCAYRCEHKRDDQ